MSEKIWTYDFDRMREAERNRLRTMPDGSPLKVYDVLCKILASDTSVIFDVMRELCCDCELSEEEVENHFMKEVDWDAA